MCSLALYGFHRPTIRVINGRADKRALLPTQLLKRCCGFLLCRMMGAALPPTCFGMLGTDGAAVSKVRSCLTVLSGSEQEDFIMQRVLPASAATGYLR